MVLSCAMWWLWSFLMITSLLRNTSLQSQDSTSLGANSVSENTLCFLSVFPTEISTVDYLLAKSIWFCILLLNKQFFILRRKPNNVRQKSQSKQNSDKYFFLNQEWIKYGPRHTILCVCVCFPFQSTEIITQIVKISNNSWGCSSPLEDMLYMPDLIPSSKKKQ